jgi:hypothetical protein
MAVQQGDGWKLFAQRRKKHQLEATSPLQVQRERLFKAVQWN